MSNTGPKIGSDDQEPKPDMARKEELTKDDGLPADGVSIESKVFLSQATSGESRIRKTIHQDEWWFSVIDVVAVLVGGDRPRKYWNDLKAKLENEGVVQLSEKIGQLKLPSLDGKLRFTDCANVETLFRIIQSIPSPKVEPLKQWLAKVGKERLNDEQPLGHGRSHDHHGQQPGQKEL